MKILFKSLRYSFSYESLIFESPRINYGFPLDIIYSNILSVPVTQTEDVFDYITFNQLSIVELAEHLK